MVTEIDKRDRADLFRKRLRDAMTRANATQSSLARSVGVDRSTLSQLLRDEGPRLPNAQLVAECARALGCSADWLLGLSAFPEQAADLMASAMSFTAAPRALMDEQISNWHEEAAGFKIRHVPATLPDVLKTRDMLRWEYEPELGRTTEQAIGASEDRMALMRTSGSDHEIALPAYELSAFAFGEGYYKGLPHKIRLAQIDRLIELHAQFYPTIRVSIFDARRLYSAPITVFGPLLAVIYLGQNYLCFRDSERVAALTAHFNRLVREADVPSHSFADHLSTLRAQIA